MHILGDLVSGIGRQDFCDHIERVPIFVVNFVVRAALFILVRLKICRIGDAAGYWLRHKQKGRIIPQDIDVEEAKCFIALKFSNEGFCIGSFL